MQSLASAILAPSLTLVADSLSLEWRKQLTRRMHQKYLKGTTFYTVSHLGGMQVVLCLHFADFLMHESPHQPSRQYDFAAYVRLVKTGGDL